MLVHDRKPVLHMDRMFGTGLHAYLALDAPSLACCNDFRLHGIPVGTQGHGPFPGARDPGEDVLRTCIDALAASRAFGCIHMRKSVVSHMKCVKRTDSGTVAQTDA